jgi:hypothetical protein
MAQGACERVAFAPPDVSLIAAIRSFETSPVIKLPLTPPTQTHANTVTRCDFLRYRVSVVAVRLGSRHGVIRATASECGDAAASLAAG